MSIKRTITIKGKENKKCICCGDLTHHDSQICINCRSNPYHDISSSYATRLFDYKGKLNLKNK